MPRIRAFGVPAIMHDVVDERIAFGAATANDLTRAAVSVSLRWKSGLA